MSGFGIAKINLRTISEIQNELHIPQTEEEEVTSNFHWDHSKTTWYTQIPLKMRSTTTDDTVIFHTNMNFHYLIATDLCSTLPALRVKKEYQDRIRICWTHNVMHNMIESAQLKFDDEVPNSFDSVWLDKYKQYFVKTIDNYNLRIGSVACLTDWNTFLPKYNLKLPLPFYYRRDLSQALPLYMMQSMVITHVFKPRNRIADLLRMQTRTRNGWKDIPVNIGYLDGAGNGLIPNPDLWGWYSLNTDSEIESEKCATERTYWYQDVIALDSINTVKYGQTNWVDLECKYPCQALFWVAQNSQSKAINYYSNYSTNLEDHNRGWNPCEKISLMYGGSPYLDNMDSDHFDGMSVYHSFQSAPTEPGYNAFSYSTDPLSLNPDIGIVFNGLKAKLLVNINNTDIFLKPVKTEFNIDEIEEEGEADSLEERVQPAFNVQVRLLVTRKLTFKKREDGTYQVLYDHIENPQDKDESRASKR